MAASLRPSHSPSELEEARQRARVIGARAIRTRLRLPSRLTLSEWADRHRVLSPESSAQPGPWRTDRAPYLREILDTISGREHQDVTIVKCSQSGGSELLLNAIGYYADQEPSPILVIQPNVKPMAEAFSKDRIAPMIRDCRRLRSKFRDPRSRDSGNTVLHKTYPGGQLSVIGANSPAGLASRPIRVVLADELDRWPASAGTEGDPLALSSARQITFRHRKKTVKVSSPGNAGESRIAKEWALSDQRHYYVPCPHCGHEQPLEWRDAAGKPSITPGRGEYRLVWEKEGEGDNVRHKPETARYQCAACTELIDETWKPAMLAQGRWVKHNPTSKRAGFHISGLLSPWVRWSELGTTWLAVKDDPEQRKTFFNTLLGLLYTEAGEEADPDKLSSRREAYAAEVPMPVGVLTAGVDVQGDRLEVEIRGWGAGEESWLVRLERIYGDPENEPAVWEELETLLTRTWKHESGASLRVRACMVDSGYLQDMVFRFVGPRQGRRVFASKGVENAKQPLSRASRANRDGVKVFTVNPIAFKDTLFARLRRVHVGPGYLHFGSEEQTGADDAYFLQFGAEKRVVEFAGNRPVVKYVSVRKRNEAIDLYVLSLTALRSLGIAVTRHLDREVGKVQQAGAEAKALEAEPETVGEPDGIPETEEPAEAEPPAPAERPRRPPRRGGGWMRGYR